MRNKIHKQRIYKENFEDVPEGGDDVPNELKPEGEEYDKTREAYEEAKKEQENAEAQINEARESATKEMYEKLVEKIQKTAEAQANVNNAATKSLIEQAAKSFAEQVGDPEAGQALIGTMENATENSVDAPGGGYGDMGNDPASTRNRSKKTLNQSNRAAHEIYGRATNAATGGKGDYFPPIVTDDFLNIKGNRELLKNRNKLNSEIFKEMFDTPDFEPTDSDLENADAYNKYLEGVKQSVRDKLKGANLDKLPKNMDTYKQQLKENFKGDKGMQDFIDRNVPSEKSLEKAAKNAADRTKDTMEKSGGIENRKNGTGEYMFNRVLRAMGLIAAGFAGWLAFSSLQNLLNQLSISSSGCMLNKGTKSTLVPINVQSDNSTNVSDCEGLSDLSKYPGLQLYDLGATSEQGPVSIGSLEYPYAGFCGCVASDADLSKLCTTDAATENFPECIGYRSDQKSGSSLNVNLDDKCNSVNLKPISSPSSNELPRCNINAKNAKDIIQYQFKNESALAAIAAGIGGAFNDAGNALWHIIKIVIIVIASIIFLVVFFKVILPLIIKASEKRKGSSSNINVNIKGGESSEQSDKKSAFNTQKRKKMKFDNWRI